MLRDVNEAEMSNGNREPEGRKRREHQALKQISELEGDEERRAVAGRERKRKRRKKTRSSTEIPAEA